MWSIQLHNNATADTLTVTLSVPAGPWTLLIAVLVLIGGFVLRVYLTERTKSVLAKHVDLDRFKREQRKIDDAWKEIAIAKAEQALNSDMLGRVIEDRNRLHDENAKLRRALNEAMGKQEEHE